MGENNTPLDFVNVVLKADSTYIAGTVSDNNGKFLFENVQGNPKYIKISSVGYSDKTLAIPSSGDLGVINLESNAVTLGEVVVKAVPI